MLPTAIEISGFRSFGSKPVLIDSLKKLNFFVGQNNSGKSNVLRSITMLSSIRGPDPRLTPRSSDFAAGAENISVCLHFPNRLLREVFVKRSGQHHQGLEEIDDSKSFAFPFTVDRNNTFAVTDAQVHRFVLSTGIQEARFRQLVQQYLGLGADTLSQARHLMQSLDLENEQGSVRASDQNRALDQPIRR